MKIIRGIKALRREIAKSKARGVGLVPTMGALHEGHLSLIRRCLRENGFTIVSIFVNPVQFAPQEDFRKYPRPFRRDREICRRAGVDAIFYPRAKDMYPGDFETFINVEGLSGLLCGKSRPGHFLGVATVVAKLFNIVRPDTAYFGQKDAQQAIIIKRMARDLDFPVKIKVLPTVREKDGLALSSRNAYLSPNERKDAAVLFQSLKLAGDLIREGQMDPERILSAMRLLVHKKKSVRIDYIAIVDPETLQPVRKISGSCIIALAVWIGGTRLIDNVILKPR
jgi:pantoate--beta-alanine ligase